MVLVPQWLRPGPARSLGNHEARIRAIERSLRAGTRNAVIFDFVTTSLAPHDGESRQSVFGYAHDAPHFETNFTLTLPLIAVIGTVIEISYNNIGSAIALITFSNIVLTNFSTGQTEGIDSTTLAVPSGTSDLVSWDAHHSGAVLLDRTFPKQPNLAVAGNYVITANGTVNFV